jgi:predicted transcriptional regulator
MFKTEQINILGLFFVQRKEVVLMAGRKPEVEDLKILEAFMINDDPAFTSSEIADYVGLTRQGVDHRLHQMIDGGKIATKKPNRDRIYWITNDGQRYYLETVSD